MTNLEEEDRQGIWEPKQGRHEIQGKIEDLKACWGPVSKNDPSLLAPVLYTNDQGCVCKVEKVYGTLYTFQKQEFLCLSLYVEC